MVSVRNLVIATSFILLFLLLNFEPSMASIFIFILLVGAFIYTTDKRPVIQLEKAGNNRLLSVGYALLGYVGFLSASFLILGIAKLGGITSIASPAQIYAEWIGSLMAQFSPALADNPLLVLVSWGVLIPIVETFAFFGTFFEWLTEMFKANIHRHDVKMWMIAAMVSGVFTLFHVTAKGLGNNPALIMTLIFGFVSMVLVIFTGQLIEAILLHVITNSTSIIMSQNLLPQITSPFMLAGIAGVALYFLVKNIKLKI